MSSEHHPSQAEFQALLRPEGTARSSPEGLRVVRHLLADCPVCRERLRTLGWDGRQLERLMELRPDLEETQSETSRAGKSRVSYDAAFAAAEKALDDFFAVGRPAERPPAELLEVLAPLTAAEQEQKVAREERFANPQWIHWLIDRSHGARYQDPARMLHLARLAHIAADACSVEAAGSAPRLADLRARSWGHYGNSLRVCGRLAEAEKAIATASRHQKEGTGDPLLRARLYEQKASLCTFQRQFGPAIELVEEACEIYEELGETHRLASSMVNKAITHLYSGDAESAVRILNRAIPLIDCEEEPHLLLAACHNLIRCYIDLDRPEQAMVLYFKARDLYKEFKDEIILLRAAWQEGQLLRELGHLRAAETGLLRARKGFMARGLAYEVATVSLDLAALYVKLGDLPALQETVAGTMPIFRALRVGRDALAALIQLQKVGDQEHQALELIRSVTSRLSQVDQRHLLK